MKIVPIILSGGSGKRLWPLSRKQFPKQFQKLFGSNSMLQQTIMRLRGIENMSSPVVICNSDHRFIVADQLQQIGVEDSHIILEPIGRNTAPAIIAAAFYLLKHNDKNDSVMLILSADHIIQDVKSFHRVIEIARKQAINGKLTTFGITPKDSNTEFGYIETEEHHGDSLLMNAISFKEKPNKELADEYLKENTFRQSKNLSIKWYWNSGMFLGKASTFVNEFSIYANEILLKVEQSVINSTDDLDFIRLEEQSFSSCSDISIDYALMEKSKNVVIVPLDARWSDIGSWSTIYEISKKDNNNNVITGDVIARDTYNSYIKASDHTLATIGVDNLVIVDTPDVIFISSLDSVNKVKTLVNELHDQNRDEVNSNRKVYRPWGWYDSIETGINFQVKRLHVNPGAKLSLQKHFKRAEHWIVVSGSATVTKDNKVFILKEGQSTFIDIGQMHSLENKTQFMLEVIEVQNGSYLGEDDIIRFEDEYGRD